METGIPGSDDKSPKEDKNIAPENMSNKALLDQLCRNSRLTPLPKPDLGSSGDESYRRRGSSPLNLKEEASSNHAGSEVHTIEDNSNEAGERKKEDDRKPIPGRIYLKQELTKPENLKPEMLVRFRDCLTQQHHIKDSEHRNGADNGSASDSEMAQD